MSRFSHTDEAGKANMVDISKKSVQIRTARASGSIRLSRECIDLIRKNLVMKGDVLSIAELAGIQAAKDTGRLIPLCHPLQLSKVDVKATLTPAGVDVATMARCVGQTGVEMEALTAAGVALLTIYDMCKAVDKQMVITDIRLVEKIKEDQKK